VRYKRLRAWFEEGRTSLDSADFVAATSAEASSTGASGRGMLTLHLLSSALAACCAASRGRNAESSRGGGEGLSLDPVEDILQKNHAHDFDASVRTFRLLCSIAWRKRWSGGLFVDRALPPTRAEPATVQGSGRNHSWTC
jgi:hypothetical protein